MKIYIDHPAGLYDYEFLPGEKTGTDVVSRKLGHKATFICNSYAKISTGDIYEIDINEEDMIIFLLKHQYKLIPNSVVEQYKNRKR